MLLAALVFLALLAVVVTAQLERLPFASSESRSAAPMAQRELDVSSALQFAIGILRADAEANDCDVFGDIWTRAQKVRVGETEIEVRMTDWPFAQVPEGEWLRHEYGIPEDVNVLANGDPYVHRLFARVRPNVNTAPVIVLARRSSLSQEGLHWLRQERLKGPLTELGDFRSAPDYDPGRYGNMLKGLAFRSRLFLAHATIRRKDDPGRPYYWVLQREGKQVQVVYSGCGTALR